MNQDRSESARQATSTEATGVGVEPAMASSGDTFAEGSTRPQVLRRAPRSTPEAAFETFEMECGRFGWETGADRGEEP